MKPSHFNGNDNAMPFHHFSYIKYGCLNDDASDSNNGLRFACDLNGERSRDNNDQNEGK